MQKQPFLFLLVSFVLGILLQEFFKIPFAYLFILLIISALSLIVFFVKSEFLQRIKNFSYLFLAFSTGVFLHFFQNQKQILPDFEKENQIIFKLENKLKSNEKNRKYEVLAWKSADNKIVDSTAFKSILIIPKAENELSFNFLYQANAYVNRVEAPKYDFQFDYQKYLERKGIFFQTYLPNGFLQSPRKSLSFLEKIKQNRLELLQKIDKTSLSIEAKELIKGIILADRTEMNSETISDFQKTGLVHILAISGTHIAIIFGIFYFIFFKLFPSRYRKYAVISSILCIWIFAIFIGLGNSVVRACIMLTIYFSYVILQRKTDFLHSMSLAAFLILLFNVNQIFDVGFQLSFSAVLGIFWFNIPILKWFPKHQNKAITLFKNIFSVTTSAQLGTLPLVLYYFHQYSWLSILANLIVLPIVEILIIGALGITFLVAIGANIPFVFSIFDVFVKFILKLIHWLSSFQFFLVENISINIFEVILLFIFLYYLRFVFKNFSLSKVIKPAYILVLFIAVRVGFYFYFQEKSEILSHQFYKQNIISTKENGKVIFYMKESVDEQKAIQFLINPYLTSRRTNDFEIKKLPKSINYIQFNGVKYDLE